MPLPDSLTWHINRMGSGDPEERRRVLEEVYPELLAVARRVDWQAARPGQTQAMELVSEAIVRLGTLRREWADREHFYATFAHAVRSTRIDALRRSRPSQDADLAPDIGTISDPEGDHVFLALDFESALKILERESPLAGQVVTMRFYLGLTHECIAKELGIPVIRCRRLWDLSRNRLSHLLRHYEC